MHAWELFQSSPVPEDGCNTLRLWKNRHVLRFNPHPSRRTGATVHRPPPRSVLHGFNPHPSRRTGATPRRHATGANHRRFQSSPVPEDGCNGESKCTPTLRFRMFQSSPVPEDGCNQGTLIPMRPVELVSILTRPGGRVQLGCHDGRDVRHTFQSSPVPEDGCNPSSRKRCSIPSGFNPHPSRRTGATSSCGSSLILPDSFNPHPSRRTGATLPFLRLLGLPVDVSILTRPGGRVQPAAKARCHRVALFQSSPVPEDGCNWHFTSHKMVATFVSILTRPGGRVQRASVFSAKARLPVSILTRPGGRVQLERAVWREMPGKKVSILTRPGGRVQPEECGGQ